MKNKGELAPRSESRPWTRADDYLRALARERMGRRKHDPKPRTQPENPRLMLSTIPFVALLAALAVIAIAMMVMAWPGNQPAPSQQMAAQHEQGYAAKGWFQEAEKQFR